MSIKDRTESVWEDIALPPYDQIKNNQKIETCIVGGGITGISIAYQMAKRVHKEKTLDCPCYGSRFNTKSKVIQGPSLSDLAER